MNDELPKRLENPQTYEASLEYWPYKLCLQRVIDYVCANAPKNSSVLDLMCGPGYLLGKIEEQRRDLRLTGVDLNSDHIDFSTRKYPGICFVKGDVLDWEPKELSDIVVCTGSIHHIPYELQQRAIERFASMVKPEGLVIISDAYVDDYSNETERRLVVAKLGYEYLKETIGRGAPDDVVDATVEIMRNDVMMKEFKMSFAQRLLMYQRFFDEVETIKTWPNFDSEYGERISIFRKI